MGAFLVLGAGSEEQHAQWQCCEAGGVRGQTHL